jgi:hypothetical protein
VYEFHACSYTTKVQVKKNGQTIKNGTYTGVIEGLLARRTYIALNEIYWKYHGTEEMEFTTPAIYRQEIVVLVVKSAQIHTCVVVYQALRRFY